MDNRRDLGIVLQSGVPIVVIESHDEARLLEMVAELVGSFNVTNYRPIFRWTVTDGLQRVDIDLESQTRESEPVDVLRHIRAVQQPGIYILLDFHPYLKDPINVRLLKDIAIGYERVPRTLILLSHELHLPAEIERFTARFDMSLPDAKERAVIVREVAEEWVARHPGMKVKTDPRAFDLLINNLAGLTLADTRRLARNAIFFDGAISKSDLPAVMQAKYELLNRQGILSYEYDTAQFADIGGLGHLKAWVTRRKAAFSGDTVAALDPPRGLLLLGVQGCGKSLAAKAVAGVFQIPLLRMDFATLYNKYHGETERNLRESLQTAEVMTPCVLWIDEIEKGLAGDGGESGTTKRVLGTFLTWLAEKRPKVFVVATANDISLLPPELMRKGRFDEIFFVDLPDETARLAILELHLRKRDRDPAAFDLARLVRASDGFSGAELEQAVVSAIYDAHARGEEMGTAHIKSELQSTRPLSVVMAEPVAALRSWARERTVQAG